MIYLDNAATTFPKPQEVYDYVDWLQRNIAVNIGRGSYEVAREANRVAENAKRLLAEFLHATSVDSVVFTSSATIAANEIIWGLEWNKYVNVYVSPFEHNAIMRPLEMARKKFGFKVIELPFNSTQKLDEEEMLRLFSIDSPDYVFLNHVSNVTGAVIPVDYIGNEAKKMGATIIVDGSQSVGLLDIDLRREPIDYLIFAGHKNIYSSWGIGGFILNSKKELNPFLAGGTGSDSLNLSMNGYEIGSPNIIAIGSMFKSLEWLKSIGVNEIALHKNKLMKKLVDGLVDNNIELYMPDKSLQHTSVLSFNVRDYEPSEVGMILDQDYGIAVRTGFHCAPLIHRLIGTESKKGTVRASISYFNTEEDIDSLLKAIREL